MEILVGVAHGATYHNKTIILTSPDQQDSHRRDERDLFQDLSNSPTPITFTHLLTAAAAVGNFGAVDHFIAQGVDPLRFKIGRFASPIRAAAVCGHTPMVRKFVDTARREFPTLEEKERDWVLVTFETAVCHAMSAGDAESVRLLLEFFNTHNDTRISAVLPKLITEGVKNGKTEALATLLKDTLPTRTKQHHQDDLQLALKEACKAGHAEIVGRILKQPSGKRRRTRALGANFRPDEREKVIQETSLAAACYGHRGLVDLLRSHGAHRITTSRQRYGRLRAKIHNPLPYGPASG